MKQYNIVLSEKKVDALIEVLVDLQEDEKFYRYGKEYRDLIEEITHNLQQAKQKTQTNFERMKLMSVDDMANLMQNIACEDDKMCEYAGEDAPLRCPPDKHCYECAKKWLESEAG